MRKVLGIIGSPRRNGNTHILMSRILEGARQAGAAAEELFLDNLRIEECDGCHSCWAADDCSKNDDMAAVYPRIIDSDVLVFGTPVYWYGPTALMKGFIDRLVYFNSPEHRAKIRGKAAVMAIVLEEKNPDTYTPTVQFFERCFAYLELAEAGRIIVPGVAAKAEILESPDRLEEALELGKSLAR